MRNKKGIIFMSIGVILIVAAFGLAIYNLKEEKRAEESAGRILTELLSELSDDSESGVPYDAEIPDYILYPDMEMPTVRIGDMDCIGILSIPALGLELPVINQWSYSALTQAPCRYSGSAYLDNMVIAAHNYRSHFGSLKNLHPDDEVIFIDADGNVFRYVVDMIENLKDTDVEEMTSGEWPLSLFTCTLDGQSRVTVRCQRQ